MEAKEFTEEITEYEVAYRQDGDVPSKKKNNQETGKKKKDYGREFLVFFRFIKVFYSLEEKDIYSFGEKADEIKKEK